MFLVFDLLCTEFYMRIFLQMCCLAGDTKKQAGPLVPAARVHLDCILPLSMTVISCNEVSMRVPLDLKGIMSRLHHGIPLDLLLHPLLPLRHALLQSHFLRLSSGKVLAHNYLRQVRPPVGPMKQNQTYPSLRRLTTRFISERVSTSRRRSGSC